MATPRKAAKVASTPRQARAKAASRAKPDDVLLTKSEVAKALRLHPRTVHRMLVEGVLRKTVLPPHTGSRGRVFVRQTDLDAYQAKRPNLTGRS